MDAGGQEEHETDSRRKHICSGYVVTAEDPVFDIMREGEIAVGFIFHGVFDFCFVENGNQEQLQIQGYPLLYYSYVEAATDSVAASDNNMTRRAVLVSFSEL